MNTSGDELKSAPGTFAAPFCFSVFGSSANTELDCGRGSGGRRDVDGAVAADARTGGAGNRRVADLERR